MERLDFDSELFEDAKFALNLQIENVLKNTTSEDFSSGEINLKLDIGIFNKIIDLPPNEDGEFETIKKQIPGLNYNVKSVLKKQDTYKGSYYNDMKEVSTEDDKFKLIDIVEPQMSIFDEENKDVKE